MFAKIFVKGIVQGVGFRNFARVMAKRSGVKGVTRNLKDGRVEIFVDAPEAQVDKFITLLKEKNQITSAMVEDLVVYAEGTPNYTGPWKDHRGKFIIDRRKSE